MVVVVGCRGGGGGGGRQRDGGPHKAPRPGSCRGNGADSSLAPPPLTLPTPSAFPGNPDEVIRAIGADGKKEGRGGAVEND